MLVEEDSPLAPEAEDIGSHALEVQCSTAQVTMCLAMTPSRLVVLVVHSVVDQLDKSGSLSLVGCNSGIESVGRPQRRDIVSSADDNALHRTLEIHQTSLFEEVLPHATEVL